MQKINRTVLFFPYFPNNFFERQTIDYLNLEKLNDVVIGNPIAINDAMLSYYLLFF